MRSSAAALVLVLVAACGGSGGTPTASPAPSPTAEVPIVTHGPPATPTLAAPTTTVAPATSVPVPTPTEVATEPLATARHCPNHEGGGSNTCLGPLTAGTYTTLTFHPPLTYTVPDGWSNMEDLPGNFLLLPPGSTLGGVNPGTSDFLGVYSSVAPPAKCTGQPSTTVDHTFDALVAFITNNPELKVTNVHDVTIGGRTGTEMDVEMKPGPGDGCPDGVWVDLYVGVGESSLVHGVQPNYHVRAALLRAGGATMLVEIADAPGGSDIADWPTAADAVAQQFIFGVASGS